MRSSTLPYKGDLNNILIYLLRVENKQGDLVDCLTVYSSSHLLVGSKEQTRKQDEEVTFFLQQMRRMGEEVVVWQHSKITSHIKSVEL